MAGFAEMAANFRIDPKAQQLDHLRREVNGPDRSISEEADQIRRRLTSEGWFKNLRLYGFLKQARNFARYEDDPPHPDAQLVFDYYEPQTEAEREMDSSPIAIAELRMDIVPGRASSGYRYVRLEERILGAELNIAGAEIEHFWADYTDKTLEGMKAGVVRAYHNPGIRGAMDIAPDDVAGSLTFSDVPRSITFLNQTGDYSQGA
jgi:hypothetical protein